MRPGPPDFRQMDPSDVALGTDARSPLPATPTGLLPSLHPHLSTAKKLAHRRPPRHPVVFQKRDVYMCSMATRGKSVVASFLFSYSSLPLLRVSQFGRP
ncbi:hypothetical protein B9Z55_020164 [Caenorhabditis nigoni]|uniref:Uncharacterized protein n=1 Tax=Caenorhabditis nigoni TaxID=1611254 RepID=A0A2G5TLL6_9PELO|nr:hypothetical protein B9Z55_020164 [Caenorhabditis nigoni]